VLDRAAAERAGAIAETVTLRLDQPAPPPAIQPRHPHEKEGLACSHQSAPWGLSAPLAGSIQHPVGLAAFWSLSTTFRGTQHSPRKVFVLDLFKTEILWFWPELPEAAMDRSHATTVIDRAVPAATVQPTKVAGGQSPQSCLTRGQRWLAGATAVAILLSGLNASVQVLKAVLDHRGQPVALRPHPRMTGKLFHHVSVAPVGR